jgi:cellulose synthase/poly-beta-1,6-N-acetylglucosamine synthase-like glycosyltransferase
MSERIIVAIPTFRRPRNLARLLEALAALDTGAEIAVLVADNDADGREGFELCAQVAPSYRWPLKAVIAAERGIAQVRNMLVAEALKDEKAAFIAMIDDDEWPDPHWITEFLKAQRQSGADALQGSILFGDKNGGTEDIRRVSGPTAMLQGAGNLFLTRARLARMTPPWFDPSFALTGGEDRDFFLRLSREGAHFAWCDEARCYGDVPESRATLGWALKRAYSTGNSDMRALLKHRPGAATRMAESAKILGALLLSLPLAVILAPSPNHRLRPLALLCRAAGKLTAMLGWRYNEYAVVHGE